MPFQVIDDSVLDTNMMRSFSRNCMEKLSISVKAIWSSLMTCKKEERIALVSDWAGWPKEKESEQTSAQQIVPPHKCQLKATTTDQKWFVNLLKKEGVFCKNALGAKCILDQLDWTQYCKNEFYPVLCLFYLQVSMIGCFLRHRVYFKHLKF